MLGHLFPSARQFRVSTNASLLVVMALAVPAEVDGVGVHVDVHEVVDNFTLDVILHPVDQETAADVDDLDEGQAPVGRRIRQSESLPEIGGDVLYFWCHLHVMTQTRQAKHAAGTLDKIQKSSALIRLSINQHPTLLRGASRRKPSTLCRK